MQTSPNPSFSQRVQRASASARFFTVSLLVHVLIIIFGGSAVMFQQITAPPDFVAGGAEGLVDDSATPQEPSVSPQVAEPTVTPPAPAAAGVSSSGINAIASASMMNNTFQVGTVPTKDITMGTAVGNNGDALSKAVAEGMAKAAGGMGRAGGTSMVKFFGKETEVKAVVFVVDISGSMVMGKKSAKTYDELEDEVKRVIRSLDMRTKFGLVAFSGDAHLYRSELIAATNDEKQRAINWLRKQSPVGYEKKSTAAEDKKKHQGTRADRGLEAAFKLEADTIFFVSDGEPTGANPAQVLKMLEGWQKGREKPAVINAVAYLADSGQKFMQDLAKKTSGTFREINPKDRRK